MVVDAKALYDAAQRAPRAASTNEALSLRERLNASLISLSEKSHQAVCETSTCRLSSTESVQTCSRPSSLLTRRKTRCPTGQRTCGQPEFTSESSQVLAVCSSCFVCDEARACTHLTKMWATSSSFHEGVNIWFTSLFVTVLVMDDCCHWPWPDHAGRHLSHVEDCKTECRQKCVRECTPAQDDSTFFYRIRRGPKKSRDVINHV